MRLRRLGRYLLPAVASILAACTINIGTGDSPTPRPSPTATPSPPPTSPSPGATGVIDVVGSGNVATETRQVSGFSRIRLRGSGQLIVRQTGAETLSIEAEDNILPLLRSDVENGVLILSLRPGTRIVTHRPIVYRLTVRELDGIEASGSGSVEAEGLDTPLFTLEGSGSVEVSLAGRAQTQQISLSGSGEVDAERLAGATATVDVSGSGEVVVNASERLDVEVSGSGDVRFVGSPELIQRVSGSGSVTRK